MIYKFKKMDCELCRQTFPFKIACNNIIVDIVNVDKPAKNYIVLESLSAVNEKVFYVVNTAEMEPIAPGQTQKSITAT